MLCIAHVVLALALALARRGAGAARRGCECALQQHNIYIYTAHSNSIN